MSDIHLSPGHLESVRGILRRHAPGAEVWAFGSRLSREAHNGSDLDLVIINELPNGVSVAELMAAFNNSPLPFRVDVLYWPELPGHFQAEIQRRHIIVQL